MRSSLFWDVRSVIDSYIPTFLDNLSVQFSRFRQSNTTLLHISEEWIPQSVEVLWSFPCVSQSPRDTILLSIKLCLILQYQLWDFTTSGRVNSVWGRPGCLRCRLFDAAWNWSGFIPTRHKIELDFYFTWSISHSELRRVSCRLVFLSQLAVSPTTHTVKGNERILTYKKYRVVAKCSLLLYWNYTWIMWSQ